MKNSDLTDFHHGWLIEIVNLEGRGTAICYSPCRKRLVIQIQSVSDVDLLYIAKQAIDYQVACSALSNLLREWYEAGQLGFDEWATLHQSLNPITGQRKMG